MKIPANGFTHGGKFHADEVFSTALLQIVRPDSKITRGFTVPDDFDGIVYDVGFGMFDHHQEPREYRANGIPYAAFGLLWQVLGAGLVGENQARLIDENFIQPLDLNDNTGEQDSLADAIGSFNPRWDSQDYSFCHTHLESVLCIFHTMLLLLTAEVYLKTHWVRPHHLLVTWQLIFLILVRFHVSLRDKDVSAFQDLKRKISAPCSNWRTPREWWFWRNSDDFSLFFHLLSLGLFPQF